ncbi:helix-turn-helix domain-containing protein [Mesorhizobium sp. NBSH29]|uniref:XRE family transcriptional regulator n=1 Tax=Mesorhizobium sp. NBSH29 TaxID=2654249 RepID=UPI0018967A60|nr:XRE family transcriptional regulator [Mesorhizobium sp. NBSH29]QPC88158.1 helix-turn-helix domain-containing protein [Mesorhizobium sp. NBSH29]
MSNIEEVATGIAERVRQLRSLRGWALAELADRSGVSRAMLSAIERGETSPTAVLLVKIATAFEMTLSSLIAQAEGNGGELVGADAQPRWYDPKTGYIRRHVSPPTDMPLELVQVELPAGKSVSLPASSYLFIRQQIWLMSGLLDFTEGTNVHHMHEGDCLALGSPSDTVFHAPGPDPAVYLVALVKGLR